MTSPLASDAAERVICLGTLPDGSACRQVIAFRYSSGALRVVVKGELYDEAGRVVVDCPVCGQRARMKPRRAVA